MTNVHNEPCAVGTIIIYLSIYTRQTKICRMPTRRCVPQGDRVAILLLFNFFWFFFFFKVVVSSVKTHCKCHGMSGSCNVKTCWRGLPNKFIGVGIKLLKLYNKTPLKVEMIKVIRFGLPKHTDSSLVYITESSDYCNYDQRVGSYGTVGRYEML